MRSAANPLFVLAPITAGSIAYALVSSILDKRKKKQKNKKV